MRAGVWIAAGLFAGLAVGHGAALQAGGSDVEQCYFEATISRDGKPVARPAALVKIGAHAKVDFGRMQPVPQDDRARLGLRYDLLEKSTAELVATVTALVDGKDVGTRTVSFTRDTGGALTMEGGGFSWKISVDLMTPAFLERKRAEKLRDRESSEKR